jgi:fructokinase
MTHFDFLKQLAAANAKTGFTVRLVDGTPVTSGISVAYAATQDQHGDAGLRFCIDHATGTDGSGCVGGWFHHDSGRYYFDSVRIFTDRAQAMAWGRKQAQIAVFDIDAELTIYL